MFPFSWHIRLSTQLYLHRHRNVKIPSAHNFAGNKKARLDIALCAYMYIQGPFDTAGAPLLSLSRLEKLRRPRPINISFTSSCIHMLFQRYIYTVYIYTRDWSLFAGDATKNKSRIPSADDELSSTTETRRAFKLALWSLPVQSERARPFTTFDEGKKVSRQEVYKKLVIHKLIRWEWWINRSWIIH